MKRARQVLSLACLLSAACGAVGTRALEPPHALRDAPAAAQASSAADAVRVGPDLASEEPEPPEPFTPAELRAILRLSPLPAPPPSASNRVADDPAAARLGQAIFFDRRFSKDGATSCSSCHEFEHGWSDGKSLSEGVTQLNRNSMSLWNVAYNRWFFWDGRADSLWAQALQPLENPLEHASSRLQIAHRLASDAALARQYEAVFGALPPLEQAERFPPVGRPVPKGEGHAHVQAAPPPAAPRRGLMPRRGHVHSASEGFYHPHQRAWDSMTPDDQQAVTRVFVNVGKSLEAFERQLLSRHAPFDVFVEGLREGDASKRRALSPEAQRGLKTFVGRGRCVLCHSGPTFSDLEFHDVGAPELEPEMPPDEGRVLGLQLVAADAFNGLGRWSDAPDGAARTKLDYLPAHAHHTAEFKTPSLRNVARSAPYHHQGQFATLEAVVEFYSSREGVRTDPPMTETLIQPLHLSASERAELVAFLRSLTDEGIPEELTRAP